MAVVRLPLNKRCRSCGYRFEADLDACPTDGTRLGRPRPGVEFLGPYRLVERLGSGGMGAIYRAVYEKAGRAVAIKLLHRSMRRETVALSRFFHEARAVNTIRHPNVVEVFDLSSEGEDVYMVLELLHGLDLRATLTSEPEGRMTPERAVLLLEQVCGALHATHAHRVVHRDLKPENIFIVRREGQPDLVKLLDFGIAKLERPEGTLTSEGVALGTPEYMAPEQARGAEVDERTDIYAVGCIAFEMLTGETPFHGASAAEIMSKQVQEPPRSPQELTPDLPDALAAVVLRCLAKSPRARFASALDAAQAFSAAAGVPFDRTGAFTRWNVWDSASGPVASGELGRLASQRSFPRWAGRLSGAGPRTPVVVLAVALVAASAVGIGWGLQQAPVTAPEHDVPLAPQSAPSASAPASLPAPTGAAWAPVLRALPALPASASATAAAGRSAPVQSVGPARPSRRAPAKAAAPEAAAVPEADDPAASTERTLDPF